MRRLIKQHIAAFAKLVRDETDGNLARDIAEKFGLVYAAGELAIKFQLLPWKSAALRGAIKKCYYASRDLLPDEGVSIRSGIASLRSYLQALPKLAAIDSAQLSSANGFRETRPSYFRCIVKREKFNEVFSSNAQAKLVTEWLIETKQATVAQASAGPKKLKEQHFWPDGKRYRSVEIRWRRKQAAES